MIEELGSDNDLSRIDTMISDLYVERFLLPKRREGLQRSYTFLPSQPQTYHTVIMVKMVPYEGFAYPCGAGDVVLRESYKPKTRGKLYYACSRSKPLEDTFGCKFFMERGMSPSTGWFSWSFNDSNLFFRIFIDSNLFSRIAILQELQHLKAILWELLEMQSAQTGDMSPGKVSGRKCRQNFR
nr:hypothetical protein [Tanacetum cinerariifolium]